MEEKDIKAPCQHSHSDEEGRVTTACAKSLVYDGLQPMKSSGAIIINAMASV
jgi:hypothetical protein